MKAKIFITFSIFSLNVFCIYFFAYATTVVSFYDMVWLYLIAFITTIYLLVYLEKEAAEKMDLNGNKPFLVFGTILFLLLTAPITFFTNGNNKDISYEISDYDREKDIVFYFNDKQLKDGIERHNQIAEEKERSGRI